MLSSSPRVKSFHLLQIHIISAAISLAVVIDEDNERSISWRTTSRTYYVHQQTLLDESGNKKIGSNIFMTFAWYGHLKLQQLNISNSWPLFAVILFSWVIALAEYSLQIPSSRICFDGNGGPFNLMQLKVIQEVI